MTKREFLEALRNELRDYSDADIAAPVSYYAELISDAVEDGKSEEEAVASLGSPEDAADKIKRELPMRAVMRGRINRQKEKSSVSGVLIAVLLICGFPIWFPLLITAVILVFTAILLIWIFEFCAWVIAGSFGIAALACLAVTAPAALTVSAGYAMVCVGAFLVMAGLCLLTVFAAIAGARLSGKGTAGIFRGIKRLFIGKKESK